MRNQNPVRGEMLRYPPRKFPRFPSTPLPPPLPPTRRQPLLTLMDFPFLFFILFIIPSPYSLVWSVFSMDTRGIRFFIYVTLGFYSTLCFTDPSPCSRQLKWILRCCRMVRLQLSPLAGLCPRAIRKGTKGTLEQACHPPAEFGRCAPTQTETVAKDWEVLCCFLF